MTKKIIALLLVLVLVFSVAGCSKPAEETPEAPATSTEAAKEEAPEEAEVKTVKIGYLTGLSGATVATCTVEKIGAELVAKTINEMGGIKSLGGAQVEIVFGDTQSDPANVPTAFEQLVSDPEISAVVCSQGSTYAIPAQGAAEKAKVPFITSCNSNMLFNTGYKYCFEIAPSADKKGTYMVEYMDWLIEQGFFKEGTIGVLCHDNDSGRDMAQGFIDNCEKVGIEIIAQEVYPPSASDISAQLLKLQAAGCETLMCTGELNDAKLILNTLDEMDWHPTIYGAGGGFLMRQLGIDCPEQVLGVCMVGNYAFNSKQAMESELLSTLIDNWVAENGYYPDIYGLGGMTNTLMLVQAIEDAGSTDRDAVRDALANAETETFYLGGPITFNEAGNSDNTHEAGMQWQRAEDGSVQMFPVWPAEECTNQLITDY